MKQITHGRPSSYSNHKCRCDECRIAWNAYCAENKRKRTAGYVYDPSGTHGNTREYHRGCRCVPCTQAASDYSCALSKGQKSKDGVCEICGRESRVVWDHDHSTGSHRGWLCVNCNQGLGLANDSPERLKRAIDYLEGGQR